jgi:hypothetical protein
MKGKQKRRGSWSAAPADQWRLTVSCRSFRHAADLSLTNKDGKQAKDDDDEKDELELHVC